MAQLMSLILLVTLVTSLNCASADIISPLTYVISEEEPPTALGNVAQDSGLTEMYPKDVMSAMTFSFPDQVAQYLDLFSVDDNGLLGTAAPVDRETLCSGKDICKLPLNIQAQTEEYFHILKVVVNIEDINDNSPRFPQDPVSISLSESSAIDSMFPIAAATDADSPEYGVQRYQLISNTNDFELRYTAGVDSENIYLVVKRKLDREQKAFYSMQVVAVDGTGLSASTAINIEVTDINDNNPRFQNRTYTMSVYENQQAPSNLLKVKALDPDAGENGQVVYSFSSKTEQEFGNMFSIQPTTGQITLLGDLNGKMESSYTLTVTAKDSGDGSLPDIAQVVIRVLDVNDHAPVIKLNTETDPEGRVHVSEAKTAGSFVAHISVSDEDLGRNKEFDCSLTHSLFTLEQLHDTDFKITIKDSLDRESEDEHEMIVLCEDHGSPVQASNKIITVVVDDANDNAPVFDKEKYELSQEENSDYLFLVQVKATDADAGRNAELSYSVEPAMEGIIQVASQSGKIYAKHSLDRETHAQLVFQVLVADGGEEPLTATTTVVVNVIDLDDENPEFTKPVFPLEVDENAPPKTKVDHVTATDTDSDQYNQFVYAIQDSPSIASNGNGLFSISEDSGIIFTEATFDREQQEKYNLVVVAKSVGTTRPVTSTAIVTISVRDLNDNEPNILIPNPSNNTASVGSDSEPGDFVTQVIATDADQPTSPNSKLTYILSSGNEDGYFKLNSTTGVLTAAKKLRNKANEIFAFVISVKDNGEPRHSSVATLNVMVNKVEGLVSDRNLTAVIIIGCVAGVVMVILIVTMALVIMRHRRQKQQKKKKSSFFQVVVEQRAQNNVNQGFAGIADEKSRNNKLNTKVNKIEQTANNNREESSQNNHLHASKVPQEVNDLAQSSRAQPVPPVSTSSVPTYCEHPSRYKLIYGSTRGMPAANKKPSSELQISVPAALQQRQQHQQHQAAADKDSDSGCSADISHSTDSGRGSQVDGLGLPSPMCSPSKWHHQSNLLLHTPPSSPLVKPSGPREYRPPPPYPGHKHRRTENPYAQPGSQPYNGLPQFNRANSQPVNNPNQSNVYFISNVKHIKEIHV